MKTLYVKTVSGHIAHDRSQSINVIALFDKGVYELVTKSMWISLLLDNKYPLGTIRQEFWNFQKIPLWYIKLTTQDVDELFERIRNETKEHSAGDQGSGTVQEVHS